MSSTNAADVPKLIGAYIRGFLNTITGWIKTIAALALALLVLSTLATMLGYPIPFIPAFRGGLQEVGIFVAAAAYFLR